ncbi:MAG: hypothetical protein MJ252_08920 [archaeon]|nr:hypothetical protein [archaeon]
MRYKEEKDDDIFLHKYIDKLFRLRQKIVDGIVEFNGLNYTVDYLCYKPIAGKPCMITSPTNFFMDDYETFLNKTDEDIKEIAKCLQSGTSGEMPCFDNLGTPIQIDAIFGQQGCQGGAPISECTICNKTAKAMSITFLLKNDIFTNKIAQKWEEEVFKKAIKEFNDDKENDDVKLDYMMERSVSDELEIESAQNIVVVIVSYSLMFLYIAVVMGEFLTLVNSRILVGLGGIFVVAISCLGAFAIVSLMGIKQSLISAEVVPFLVLAIGADNMFIITSARDRVTHKMNIARMNGNLEKEYTNEEQIAMAMKEVGPSITTAALGEFLSFLVGYFTDIPALESFCLCSSFAVLINYFLQMSLFVAFVSLDDSRIKNRRYDLCPLIKVPEEQEIKYSEGKVKLQEFVSTTWYGWVKQPAFKYTALAIYGIMTILSCVAVFKFPLGLNQQTTVTQEGDLFNYFKAQEKYVDVGSPAYLVFYNIDYSNEENLKLIDKMSDHIATLSSVKPPVYSWYKDFQKFMNSYYEGKCNPNRKELLKQPLASQVKEFLKMKADGICCTQDAICGEPYSGDITFNQKGEIEASRFRFQHVALVNQSIYVDSVIQTNAVAREYKDKFTLYPGKSKTKNFNLNGKDVDIPSVFPYSLFYVYYDQYLFIRGITIQNLLIGFAVVFVAVQIIASLKCAATVVLFVFSSTLHLLGVLFLLNYLPDYKVELNAVSAVNIVVALGLSVEFCVHVIIFYCRGKNKTNEERVRYALKNVGASVLIGIMTTKIIGVFVLFFAPSKVFQVYYFRMYFFLILVGFFHGFILLPLFLTYVNIAGGNSKSVGSNDMKYAEHISPGDLENEKLD